MSTAIVVYIPGDGIGPEVVKAAIRAVDAAAGKHNHAIDWREAVAGKKAFERSGDPLPQEVIDLIRQHKRCLKGPMETPLGEGYKSPNVRLRQALDLYQCVRPIRKLPNVPSPLANSDGIDLVIFRENTEDLYTGEETGDDAGAVGFKRISRKGCERIVHAAFEYAIRHGRKKVTAAAKPNIMKLTDGLFKRVAEQVAKEYIGQEFEFLIVDNCLARLITNPRRFDARDNPDGFDVLVTLNLYGDILSDGVAALVGGLGVAPGANIGSECAVFEAVHGTAPKIPPTAGNPTALMLSGTMLLEHLGWEAAAKDLTAAVEKTLAEGTVLTGDLLPLEKRSQAATTERFADAVVNHI